MFQGQGWRSGRSLYDAYVEATLEIDHFLNSIGESSIKMIARMSGWGLCALVHYFATHSFSLDIVGIHAACQNSGRTRIVDS